ncbi:glycosyltransferase [Halomonas sp. BC04]|uniref:glycosyltransferase n=1 Tax=Halomonas sp. BC04 TaxID=1403540 RepID=UPI0003ED8277|nr:glycosyltransferase [Halomonas sp. BC04]EWH01631.1 hypothetical protein Q427_13130 [Halomonas sp. BC04]
MKIVFFVGDMFQGGAERQLVYLCNGLTAKGHDITLLTLRDGEAYSDLLSPKVNRHVLEKGGAFNALFQLTHYLRANRPDVVVNFLFHAALLGRVAACLCRVPSVTSHRNVSYGKNVRNILIRLTERLDDATHANVASADSALSPLLGKRPLHVIPNVFLPIGSVQLSGSNTFSSVNEPATFRWCFVGRLEEQKNLPALLEAFSYLVQSGDQAIHLDIAGSGRLQEELNRKIAELGLGSHVTLHGQLDSTHELLEKADAFVLPSRWEGMPNALMEAMAMRIPCVATPVGAVPEMLGDGRGVIAEGTESEALVAAMQAVMALSQAERQAMGAGAADYIAQKCSLDSVIERWELMLKQAVES